MKVMRSAFLGLGLLLAVSAAQAQEPRVKANIPFDFVVGDRVMPAGEYMSGMGASGTAIAILSDDRKANVLMLDIGLRYVRAIEEHKAGFPCYRRPLFLVAGLDRGILPRPTAPGFQGRN